VPVSHFSPYNSTRSDSPSLWETVVWPSEIILAEDDFEREYRCPSPTPSERIIPDPSDGLFEEWPLTSLEQQLELDEEIQERDARAHIFYLLFCSGFTTWPIVQINHEHRTPPIFRCIIIVLLRHQISRPLITINKLNHELVAK